MVRKYIKDIFRDYANKYILVHKLKLNYKESLHLRGVKPHHEDAYTQNPHEQELGWSRVFSLSHL